MYRVYRPVYRPFYRRTHCQIKRQNCQRKLLALALIATLGLASSFASGTWLRS